MRQDDPFDKDKFLIALLLISIEVVLSEFLSRLIDLILTRF